MTNTPILNEKFSILLSLPKKCGCTLCAEIKKNIKLELGEKEFSRVCKSLEII